MRKVQRGFTLLELMIVIAIVAALAAIALPAYNDQLRKSRRSDAKIALVSLVQLQENYYAARSTYAPNLSGTTDTLSCNIRGICSAAGDNDRQALSLEGFYTLEIPTDSANARAFIIEAVPVSSGPQADDAHCTKFIINNRGVKTAEGTDSDNCW